MWGSQHQKKPPANSVHYELLSSPAKTASSEKGLAIIVTNDLNWNKQVHEASSKAYKMVRFIRRSAFDIWDLQQVRKPLHLVIVRNRLVYCSQMWASQTVKNILSIERVHYNSAR